MSDLINQQYLLNEEYKDASKLNARLQFFQRFSISGVDQYRWIFEHFDLKPGSRILELGCGSGLLWQKNLDRIPPDWTITLSDFSPGMLQEAQRNLHDSSQNFSFQVIDVQAIPLEDSRFDAVIANNMLYHVPDRQRAFSEIHRVLKPDGHFYTSTFAQASFSELKRLVEQNDLIWIKPLGFSLENGVEQLSFWFAHVDLDHLENVLMVTETEPLLQLICSGIPRSEIDEEKLQRLRASIEQELSEKSAIRTMMQNSLFMAYFPK